MAPDMAKAVKEVWTDQMAAERPNIFDTGEAWMGEAKTPKAASAAAYSFDDFMAAKSDDAPAKIADLSAKSDGGLAKSGPSEALMTASTPAAAAYPPCHRGAGDDHCIQLYDAAFAPSSRAGTVRPTDRRRRWVAPTSRSTRP